jgi:hypothetical protein
MKNGAKIEYKKWIEYDFSNSVQLIQTPKRNENIKGWFMPKYSFSGFFQFSNKSDFVDCRDYLISNIGLDPKKWDRSIPRDLKLHLHKLPRDLHNSSEILKLLRNASMMYDCRSVLKGWSCFTTSRDCYFIYNGNLNKMNFDKWANNEFGRDLESTDKEIGEAFEDCSEDYLTGLFGVKKFNPLIPTKKTNLWLESLK